MLLYGRALGLSHGEAEDVLHDTFVALLRLADEPANPAHYAVRAFRHRALNYRRSLWRRLAREVESQHWFERGGSETDLEQAAMRRLSGLPAEQREVIVLKIWHRYTFDEIGALLVLSPNTVASRYRAALRTLRACLKGTEYERNEQFGEPPGLLETAPPFEPA
jgi:RNA polymerase sigma-70 factor, ECF subfamily